MKNDATPIKPATQAQSEPQVHSSARLECGHPGLPNNLRDGKCGTCQCANEFDELSKAETDPDLKVITAKIAEMFRNGNAVYDANGTTLWELSEASRPHSNDGTHAPRI